MSITDTDRFILYSFVLIFNVIGLFGNSSLITAHYRIPALRTKYGILLCLLAFCESLCLLFEWVNVVYGLAEIPIVRSTCFRIISPYIFMRCAETGLVAMISVDLFLSIVMPLRHRVYRKIPYVCVFCLPPFFYGTAVLVLASLKMDNELVELCNPPMTLPLLANEAWYFVALLFGGVTIVTYIISYASIVSKKRLLTRRKSFKSSQRRVDTERKALKSLSVFLVVFLVCRYTGVIVSNLMNILQVDRETASVVQSYNVIPALMCYSCSYYVCYFRSSEYRRIFRCQLACMLKAMGCTRLHLRLFAMDNASARGSSDSNRIPAVASSSSMNTNLRPSF